jgi:alpha-D-ribose 1-methylphosphonate 5-triphosphate synthase subunit PhnH
MARPGSVHGAGIGLVGPIPLSPATAAVLLALIDGDVRLWLDPAFAAARDWVAFHCGASPIAEIGAAAFVATPVLPDPSVLCMGSYEAPETGATVVLQVAALGAGTRYRLRGPGLRVPGMLAVAGLPPGFAAIWQSNHASFPRGFDLLLCAGTQIAALPRSVAVEEV